MADHESTMPAVPVRATMAFLFVPFGLLLLGAAALHDWRAADL
jgi:hypothetical protein